MFTEGLGFGTQHSWWLQLSPKGSNPLLGSPGTRHTDDRHASNPHTHKIKATKISSALYLVLTYHPCKEQVYGIISSNKPQTSSGRV